MSYLKDCLFQKKDKQISLKIPYLVKHELDRFCHDNRVTIANALIIFIADGIDYYDSHGGLIRSKEKPGLDMTGSK